MSTIKPKSPPLSATTSAPSSALPSKVVYDQFIFFGDSITQIDGNPELGYSCYQAFQYDYVRRVDIINRGFAAYNTGNALEILPRIFPAPGYARVRLVTIFFGANDASDLNIFGVDDTSPPSTTGRRIPLEQFKSNLRKLVSHAVVTAHAGIKVLLIPPPPVDEWQLDEWEPPHNTARKAAITRTYAEAVGEVGKETGAAVVDLWTACMREVGWDGEEDLPGDKKVEKSEGLSKLLYDGLHLGGDGYKVLYREMKKVIAEKYPELVPSNLPVVLEPFFPEWFQ